jgi:anti-sigma factor RsiW
MTCQEFDWKGFALDEITAPDRRRMEEHLLTCAACGEELASIRLTMTAMKRLPVMAVPRRISFVSDPVFEPSWWQRFLSSGPKLGFASAAMLSMAILAHGLVTRPQIMNVPAPVQVAAQQAAPVAQPVSAEEIRAQVLAEVSAKLALQEKKAERQRQADMTDVKSAFDTMQKRVNNMYLSAARYGGD